MNTNALIVLHPRGARAAAEGAVANAERRANDIEQIFSRFIPTSELSRLNGMQGGWHEASPEMDAVLRLAARLHHLTSGIFDPAVLPDLERAGYDRTFDALPAARAAAPVPTGPRSTFAELEERDGGWRVPAGMRIDLGGIVKGWAADSLANDLAEIGPVLVELGGDTAVRGVPPDRDAWDIGVQAPGRPGELLSVLAVEEGGVATSGRDRRQWRMGPETMHHLIDPRTRLPAITDLVQVTAIAPSAALAEVWAKTALIAGSVRGSEIVVEQRDVQLLLVPEGEAAVASSGVRFAVPEIVALR